MFEVQPIDAGLAARMTPTSWRPGCPVALADLRYLRVGYWAPDGSSQVGELVVHADVAPTVGTIFGALYAARFPVTRMRLVDDYGGSDDASVAADNTSAFNCRAATGSTNWSQHAFGRAIDVNPIENPYIGSSGAIDQPASEPYRDRAVDRPGMFVEGGAALAAFDRAGWDWGGRWSSPVDYQHFSRDGG